MSDIRVDEIDLRSIRRWREHYRREMDCQIVHDSLHRREGWTKEFLLSTGGAEAGYGAVAVGGPWVDTPTVYEFYVAPEQRVQVFDLFRALLDVTGAVAVEVQTNDPIASAMLYTFAQEVTSRSILFHDKIATSLENPPGALFREATAADFPDVRPDQLRWHGVIEMDGKIAASGGILFHYNPPYGDIFMEVSESYRRRGLGSFLVQRLKLACYEGGYIPAARCRADNLASRRTLQKAGFVPCGHMLSGTVR